MFVDVLPGLHLQMKQVCYWQLPPRRFWLNWCDGLTVLEAFLVAAFAALHIILVNDLVVYYSRQMDACECNGCEHVQLRSNRTQCQQMQASTCKQALSNVLV